MKSYAPARPSPAVAVLATLLLAALLAFAAPARAADPVIAAAGDVACAPSDSSYKAGLGTATACRQKYTSDLLVGAGLSRVLALGDLQYDSANYDDFRNAYDPSWGRVKSITSPIIGNHEPGTASGYYDYFNGVGVSTGPAGQRGKGYYSYNLGAWHLIALNSNIASATCSTPTSSTCQARLTQEQWLRDDLAANPDKCTLASWHHPRFSSGHDGNNLFMQPLWQQLYDASVDVLLVGHSHNYERFAPQDASGGLDRTKGVREFVVGTGGAFFTGVSHAEPNSEVRQNYAYGVLFLTLRPSGYAWEFVPEAGKTFTDSGTATCHRATAAYKLGAGLVDEGGSKTLSYVADSGQANDVTVARFGTSYVITDNGVSSIADADGTGGCSVVGNRATCSASGVSAIRVDVGDGDDSAFVDDPVDATILGGTGVDRLTGGDGNDNLEGWTGNDVLLGGLGDDVLDGGSSDDVLEGGDGNDTLRGGSGSDTADYSSATAGVRVSLAMTTSQTTGGAGRDSLLGLENLTGGSGADNLTGDVAVNVLKGAAGDDTIQSRDTVRDPLSCGDGSDLAVTDVQDVPTADCERWDNGAAPETTIVSGPSGTVNTGTATFSFSSNEPGTFECKLDGAAWAFCPSPKTYTALARGSHSFNVVAIDQFGNRDPSEATRTWTVQFFPAVSFIYSPAVPYVNEPVTFSSTSTPTGPNDVLVGHEWDLDGDGTFETNTGGGTRATASYPRAGTVTVGLRVTDDDGERGIAKVAVAIGERPLVSPLVNPPAPPLPGPGGNVDTRSPGLVLSGRLTQRFGRADRLTLFARCDEVCTVVGSARVSVQRTSKALRANSATRALTPGEKGKLAIRFSRKAARMIRRLLAQRKRVLVTVKVVSKDRAGNVTSLKRKIRLTG